MPLPGQAQSALTNARGFDCNTPIQGGALRVTGGFAPQGTHDYDLSLALNRVPLAALATLARHAKRGLPDDVTASGEVNAAFGFHSHQGTPRDWHGTGMTSNFLLESALASKPIPVSAIRFHIGATETGNNPVVLPAIVARRVHVPLKKAEHAPPPGSDAGGSTSRGSRRERTARAGRWSGWTGAVCSA